MTVVDTDAGAVRGTLNLTRHTDVEAYLGIPFADPPVGAARFAPPRAVTPWAGVRDAKRFGAAAPQNADPVMQAGGFWQPPTDEATCLNVNVWTPLADDRARPVLVWVHGGAYVTGSNASGYNNGAELAAALDVVVVSMNYRLGALGFLYLGDLLGEEYADSGNVALLDMTAALQWVQRNIAHFGGDPNNVTLFGESAGAAAVGTLLGSRAAEGLFQRAIMQSGTAERARTIEESAAVTREFLAALDLREEDAHKLLELPTAELLAAQATVGAAHAARVIGLPLPFQPTIDGRVLDMCPLEAIRAGRSQDVALLVGTNLNEASFFTVMRPADAAGPSLAEQLLALASEDFGADAQERLAQYRAALAQELGREPSDDDVFESYLSDRLYRQPSNRLLAAREGAAAASYSYIFTWPSPLYDGRLGACHALEVPFVFRQLERIESQSLVGSSPPTELAEWMSGAWVEFARRGAPSSPGLPGWPAYEPGNRATMLLDTRPGLSEDPRGGLREFWRSRVAS